MTGLTARDIAGAALQEIGAWPTSQSQPDERELRRAVDVLDAIVDELAGTVSLPWLEREVFIRLVHRQTRYELEDYLTEDLRGQGAEFWRAAKLYSGVLFDSAGEPVWDHQDPIYDDQPFRPRDYGPLDRLWREQFEALESDKTGQPCAIYVERKLNPVVNVWPIPILTSPPDPPEDPPVTIYTPWSLKLVLQVMAPEVDRSLELTAAWRRHLTYATAYDLSGGRIRRLPVQARQTLLREKMVSLERLEAINTRNHHQPTMLDGWGEGPFYGGRRYSERALYGEDER